MNSSRRTEALLAQHPRALSRLPFVPTWFPYFFGAVILVTIASGALAQQSPVPVVASSPAPVTAVVPSPQIASPSAQTPAASTGEDIRDIRGPISIPSPWRWLWVALVVFGVLGVLYQAWRWYRLFAKAKRKQPFEIALQRLEEAKALMTPQQAREYSFAVSEITREYIEARFGERAARRTTNEFLHELVGRSDSALAAHQPLLADFLRHCDLAKFGRWELSEEQLQSMHESARTFIMWTRPEPEGALPRTPSKNGTKLHVEPMAVPAMQSGRGA